MIIFMLAFQSINYLTKPISLPNCYLPNCTIRLTEANQSVCIDLESTKNKECEVLENGINITINLVIETNLTGQPATNVTKTIFGYYYGFNYSETKTICIDSDNPTNAANDFYLASSSQVVINSIGYTSTFAPGLIQRISGDNSDFINETVSTVYFNLSEICAYVMLINTYVSNFNINNIVNATLVISDYYGSKKSGNLTIPYDSVNKSSFVNLKYDSTKKLFIFCSTQYGITTYPYLDTSLSNGYLNMYYSIDQSTTNPNPSDKMTIYFEGKIVNYEFTSLDLVFREINLIIMESQVAIQSILSSDPKLIQQAQNYTNMLKQYPNNQGMRLTYIYCMNDPSLFGSAYNSHKVGFSNVSQLLNENLFAPNKSIQSNIDKLQSYARQDGGCQPKFKYQMFAFNGSNIIGAYSQQGNLAYYSCFTQVKFSSTGEFMFVRNDLNCTRFNQSQTVYFEILDINTRKSLFQYKVNNFSVNELRYQIPVNFTINPTNNTLQILNSQRQMIDMVVFFSVTEVDSNVATDKAVIVGVFGSLQFLFISGFILLRKTVVPKIQEKIQHQRQLVMKMKSAMLDL